MDNENKESIDNFDDKEYERALEALNSSKGSRVQKINSKKKQEKKEIEKKKAEQEANLSFIEKCKRHKLVTAFVIVFILFDIFLIGYSVNNFVKRAEAKKGPSLGITYSQLQERYTSTTVYTQYLSSFGFEVPNAVLTDSNSDGASNNNEGYFNQPITSIAESLGINAAIEGTVRKADGKITELRIYSEINPNYDNYMQILLWFFQSYLEVLYPDMTDMEVAAIPNAAISDLNSYIVYGDYAVRMYSIPGGNGILGLQIIPAASVDNYVNPSETAA